MSCRILVDESATNSKQGISGFNSACLINGRASPSGNRSNSMRYLLKFSIRTIFLRRFRLLKLCITTVAILLILFFFFKSNATTKHENQLLSVASSMNQDVFEDENNHAMAMENSHDRTIHVAKNFSFSLTSRDFSLMRNKNVMQMRIRDAAKHSWDNYRRYAWGFDMLKPLSKEPDHWFDLGLTIVDAADTLIMMGMSYEANLAIDWMENELHFDSKNENSNCFEMTIRILAGLLSTFHLTGSEKLKHRAIQFGDILLHCYDTNSGIIPYSDIDLNTRKAHPPIWNPASSLSEVTSLQLEFRYLSQISGDPKYEEITFRTSKHIHNLTQSRTHKLLPMYVNPTSGQLEDSIITLGARSDSYYEYLLKQYLQTGIKWLEADYLDTMDQVRDQLFRYTGGKENYTYVAEMQVFRTENNTEEIRYSNKMDHLVCFLPGTLILGYYHFSPLASEKRLKHNLETPTNKLNSRYNTHIDMAKSVARTCYHMYSKMGTGLSPEIANFVHADKDDPIMQNQPELQVQSQSAHNILRPEFVESLFYLYHITGLPIYREQASEIFEAFEKYSRMSSGYSAISDVRIKPDASTNLEEVLHKHAPDRMESFWLSETLKYLYLTFCDDEHIISTMLNNYIFNTEAHLFPIASRNETLTPRIMYEGS